MFRTANLARIVIHIALASCVSACALAQSTPTAVARPAATSSAATPSVAANVLNISFEGTLAGPSDVRKPISAKRRSKVGDDPCHRGITVDRNRCDTVVDIIAGAADDERTAIRITEPRAMVTDSQGRLLIADATISGVHIFDMKKKKYSMFRVAPEDRASDRIVGISVDAQDSIYVTEQSSGLVLVYDAHGKFQRTIGTLEGGERIYEQPSGIAVDRKTGRIYLADFRDNCLFILDANGKMLKSVGRRGGGDQADAFRGPRDVVISGDAVYVLDTKNQRIQKLDLNGNFTAPIALFNTATCMGVDATGAIYVGDPVGGTVSVLDGQTHRVRGSFGAADIQPTDVLSGIWVAPDQFVYIANLTQHRVEVFRLNPAQHR